MADFRQNASSSPLRISVGTEHIRSFSPNSNGTPREAALGAVYNSVRSVLAKQKAFGTNLLGPMTHCSMTARTCEHLGTIIFK